MHPPCKRASPLSKNAMPPPESPSKIPNPFSKTPSHPLYSHPLKPTPHHLNHIPIPISPRKLHLIQMTPRPQTTPPTLRPHKTLPHQQRAPRIQSRRSRAFTSKTTIMACRMVMMVNDWAFASCYIRLRRSGNRCPGMCFERTSNRVIGRRPSVDRFFGLWVFER